jgi:hypothetical protein
MTDNADFEVTEDGKLRKNDEKDVDFEEDLTFDE